MPIIERWAWWCSGAGLRLPLPPDPRGGGRDLHPPPPAPPLRMIQPHAGQTSFIYTPLQSVQVVTKGSFVPSALANV
jgi:hypothetical protein